MAQARHDGVAGEQWELLHGARPSDPVPRGFVRALWGDLFTWIAALFFEGLLAASAQTRGPAADLPRGLLRVGRRTVPFSEIDRAHIGIMERQDGDYGLRLRADRVDIFVPVRRGSTLMLESRTRDLLLAILPLTSIRMPEDRFDPTGKFARHNFPGYLTRDEAVQFITTMPVPETPTFWG